METRSEYSSPVLDRIIDQWCAAKAEATAEPIRIGMSFGSKLALFVIVLMVGAGMGIAAHKPDASSVAYANVAVPMPAGEGR